MLETDLIQKTKRAESMTLAEKWDSVVALMLLCNGFKDIEWGTGKYKGNISAIKDGVKSTFSTSFNESDSDKHSRSALIKIRDEYGNPCGLSVCSSDWVIHTLSHVDDFYHYFLFIKTSELKSIIKKDFKKLNLETLINGQFMNIPLSDYRRFFNVKKFKKL